jgi:hypothetical protein
MDSMERKPQGAFIWLLPEACDHVAQWLEPQPHNTHLVKFDVPLKGGDVFNTYTVSPLEQSHSKADANWLAGTLLATFTGSIMGVAVKRQNTANHLDACIAWRNHRPPLEQSTS